MVGITSYGAYIPLFRIGIGTLGWEYPFERSVANFDEDSITMAVAAVIDCLNGKDRRGVDALYFATTSPPYLEKQCATLIATASDLRTDIFTTDCTDTLRGGTSALKMAVDAISAGSAKQAIVATADCRLAPPRSMLEMSYGDGAAALMLGTEKVAAVIKGSYSVAREIVEVWRAEGEKTTHTWEDRFNLEVGYLEALKEAFSGILKKYNMTPKDFTKVIFPATDPRRPREVARMLGLEVNQIQDPLLGTVGNTGAASPLMLLVAALEEAKPGNRFLLAGYGDGCDAFILEVTDEIEKIKDRRGIKKHLASKKILPSYEMYLQWRGFHSPETPGVRRPPLSLPAAPALFREQEKNIRFYGVKCQVCGTVQYPPQVVCTKCGTRGKFDKVRLSDKKATLFTFAMDFISGTVDVPLVIAVINFEGGGRALLTLTDRLLAGFKVGMTYAPSEEIKVGMPLEMSFRKLYSVEGIQNYYWKCIPVRV